MSIQKLKNNFFGGAWINDVKSYFNKINEIIDVVNAIPSDTGGVKTVATYALMVADGTPSVMTIYLVTVDENKGITDATYMWFPNGTRMWIASTID